MHERDLQIFIDGATNFFSQITGDPAVVGTPYLVSNRLDTAKGFTGIIGISGERKGSVYFTAPPVLIKVLLMSIGEEDTSHEQMCDMVGEVANTISGNARRSFGKDFMISVPIVVIGKLDEIVVPNSVRSFVIPVGWRNYDASLVISLE